MAEWLVQSFAGDFEVLVSRVVAAFLLGWAVAGIYWLSHRRDETLSPSFVSTLVLLSILIAMVTQVIGNELARAFGLVGALSIVRFRTVVEDTRDTAFVIFAVVVGMAAGADEMAVAVLGLPVVAVAAVILRPRRTTAETANPPWSLTVRLGVGHAPELVLATVLRDQLEAYDLLATTTARQGAAVELTYRVRLRPASTPTTLVTELNRLEGVQNVELRRL